MTRNSLTDQMMRLRFGYDTEDVDTWRESVHKLGARVEALEATLRETAAWPCVAVDGEDFLECRWCASHTHTADETADAIDHWPGCRLLELGLVSAPNDSPGNPDEKGNG